MRMASAVTLGLLAALAMIGAATAAGGEDNAWLVKLKSLPDGEWVGTGVPWADSYEVPLAYSPDHRLLFRYGGCTHERGGYEEYGYGNDLWVLGTDRGKWDMRRAVHSYACQGRPIAGCSRTFCYDRKRKVFWLCHGIGGNTGVGYTAMASYDPVKDLFTPANAKGSHVGEGTNGDGLNMVYDPVHDVVVRVSCMPAVTKVFDPKTSVWKNGAQAPAVFCYYSYKLTCDEDGGRVILLAYGPKAWEPGQPQPKPPFAAGEQCMRTWAYDAGADKWSEIKAGGDVPEPRMNNVVVWDSRNKALLYHASGGPGVADLDVGKPAQTCVLDLKENVWKKQSPKAAPPAHLMGGSAVYDENHNVMLAYIANQLWAYRYKGGWPEEKR
jgi:hypothetical protein